MKMFFIKITKCVLNLIEYDTSGVITTLTIFRLSLMLFYLYLSSANITYLMMPARFPPAVPMKINDSATHEKLLDSETYIVP